jgi:Tfp pilus assembly protein PilF
MRTLAPGLRRVSAALLLGLAIGPTGACAVRPRGTGPVAPAAADGAGQVAGFAEVLLREGDVARREGRTDDAIARYEQSIDVAPGSIPAHLRLVATLLESGRRSQARDRYEARARSPHATHADRVMAARLATDGSADALRAVYLDAVRAQPAEAWWRLALAELDLAAAESELDRLRAARGAGDRPAAADARARAADRIAAATRAVGEAAARAPSLAEVPLYRGLATSLEGDMRATAAERAEAWKGAAADFEAALAADPSLVDAWAALADARQRAGQPDEALAAWLGGLRLAPGDADLRRGAGLTLHDLERFDDAARMYLDAARLDPLDASSLLNAGDAQAAAGRFEAALETYDQALARDPDAVEALVKRGAVLERMGRPAEARAAYVTYLERGGAHAADARRRIERIVGAEDGR